MARNENAAVQRLNRAALLTAEAARLFRHQLRQKYPALDEDELKREHLRRVYRNDPGILEILNRGKSEP